MKDQRPRSKSLIHGLTTVLTVCAYFLGSISFSTAQNLENSKTLEIYNIASSDVKQEIPFVTKFYIVQPQDTLYALSRKYNISISGLRRLNPGNKELNFDKALTYGITIVVPSRILTKEEREHFDLYYVPKAQDHYVAYGSLLNPIENTNKRKENLEKNYRKKENPKRIKKTIVQKPKERSFQRINRYIAENSKNISVSSIMQSIAQKLANETIASWVNKYGSAKIHADFSSAPVLSNLELDLLLPVYDSGPIMAFAQSSLYRANAKIQANFGFGGRYFYKHAMIGINGFLDYDFSGRHARLGSGLEYWIDYIRLATNGYLALTGWSYDKHLFNTRSRPANGFDFQVDAYIPKHPQFGFHFDVEKYYGKVASFTQDRKSTDPTNFTFGINYTPVPLLSFDLSHKRSNTNENATYFGMQIIYRFGIPIYQQTRFETMGMLRTLSGGRYDFVKRNKNIIMQYDKGATLLMKEKIEGHSREKKEVFIEATLNAEWAIEWETDGNLSIEMLNEACGSPHLLKECKITLPDYIPVNSKDRKFSKTGEILDPNTYPLIAIFTHKVTKLKQTKKSIVIVKEGENDDNIPHKVSLTITKDPLFTEENTDVILKLPEKDVPLESIKSEIKPHGNNRLATASMIKGNKEGIASIGQFEKLTSGDYKAQLYSGSDENTYDISIMVDNEEIIQKTFTVYKPKPEDNKSNLTLNPEKNTAGKETRIILALYTNRGQPITNRKEDINFRIQKAEIKDKGEDLKVVEEKAGIYVATVSLTQSGHYTVTPLVKNLDESIIVSAKQLIIEPGALNIAKSSIHPRSSFIPTDTSSGLSNMTTVHFIAKDEYENPLQFDKENVKFLVSMKGDAPENKEKYDAEKSGENTYKFDFYSVSKIYNRPRKPGAYFIVLEYNGFILNQLSTTIKVDPNYSLPDAYLSKVILLSEQPIADGTSPAIIQFCARDSLNNTQGNLLDNDKVNLKPLLSANVENGQEDILIKPFEKNPDSTASSCYITKVIAIKPGQYTVHINAKNIYNNYIRIKSISVNFGKKE